MSQTDGCYFVLCGEDERFWGIFTSPTEAMRHVYLSEVYQIMRGYDHDISEIVWEKSSGGHWYGRAPEEYTKSGRERKPALYHIQRTRVDWMPPLVEELMPDFGESPDSEHPSFNEWLEIHERA